MSTTIGDPSRFAITYQLNEETLVGPEPQWMFGSIKIVASDLTIGHYDHEVPLKYALEWMPRLLARSGTRRDERLAAMQYQDAYKIIYEAMYVDKGQPDEEVREANAYFKRFKALPSVMTVFDDWLAFLIETDHGGNFIWSDPEGEIHLSQLAIGEYESVVRGFMESIGAVSASLPLNPDPGKIV